MFWNLLQDHRFFTERERANHLEVRVKALEQQATDLQDLLKKMLHTLEVQSGVDINKDGSIGKPPAKRYFQKKSAIKDNRTIRRPTKN